MCCQGEASFLSNLFKTRHGGVFFFGCLVLKVLVRNGSRCHVVVDLGKSMGALNAMSYADCCYLYFSEDLGRGYKLAKIIDGECAEANVS